MFPNNELQAVLIALFLSACLPTAEFETRARAGTCQFRIL
jgi:hypothetical protein